MKRYHAPKRRDRKTGQSPYDRHDKAECRYSPAYYSWRGQHVRTAEHAERKRLVRLQSAERNHEYPA